ncbi:MAG: flagellar protein FliT [Proteobacteria bacterium]|nr:flagellar protein FliT [Pseudomonadota bacterium]
MVKKEIFKKLLSLSKKHLHLVADENWEEWERVADQKEKLYRKLGQLPVESVDDKEMEIISEIRKLEEETKKELDKKRDEVKQRLLKINRTKSGLKGYREATKKVSGRRLGLKG